MAKIDRETLVALRERLVAAVGADRRLDADLYAIWAGWDATHYGSAGDAYQLEFEKREGDKLHYHFGGEMCSSHEIPGFTENVDDAVDLIERALPGFWQSSGLCSLTGHASIGPDYNGPDGDRLRREWPEERFHSGFDADLKPGDGRHRQCYALLDCLLQALVARIDLTSEPANAR